LQLTKMVDVYKYEHLKLAPQHLIKGTDFILKCIWTIVNHKGQVDGYRISDEFFKATGYRLSDFFEFTKDDIITFIKGRQKMFAVNEKTKMVKALQFDEKSEFNLSGIGTQSKKPVQQQPVPQPAKSRTQVICLD